MGSFCWGKLVGISSTSNEGGGDAGMGEGEGESGIAGARRAARSSWSPFTVRSGAVSRVLRGACFVLRASCSVLGAKCKCPHDYRHGLVGMSMHGVVSCWNALYSIVQCVSPLLILVPLSLAWTSVAPLRRCAVANSRSMHACLHHKYCAVISSSAHRPSSHETRRSITETTHQASSEDD